MKFYFEEKFTVKRNQGCKNFILMFYVTILLASFDLKADSPPVPVESSTSITNDISAHDAIEEGWVEKKIAPPTLWIESIFAPFTQWMESEIQQEPDSQAPSFSDPSSSHRLISVKYAINTVLEKYPGKVLRSQFKTGPPPYYKIKILSDKGSISIFNVHAFSGNVFTPSDLEIQKEEFKP